MKYIDADLLRKEIERRRLQNRYIDTDGYEQELFEIIDFLRQEHKAVEGVVHHVATAHYIVTDQEQLNARLREIPEGTKVNIFICKAKEE